MDSSFQLRLKGRKWGQFLERLELIKGPMAETGHGQDFGLLKEQVLAAITMDWASGENGWDRVAIGEERGWIGTEGLL